MPSHATQHYDAKPEMLNEPHILAAFSDPRPTCLEFTASSADRSAEEGRNDRKYQSVKEVRS
jgi:hypothetical protein